MKSLIDRVSEIYDELYDEADRIMKKYHPCHAGYVQCRKLVFCCQKCKYLVEDGCSVKSIWCKTWLCGDVRFEEDTWECDNLLQNVRIWLLDFGFRYERLSKSEHMANITKRSNKSISEVVELYDELHKNQRTFGALGGGCVEKTIGWTD